jgi:hypothetical protein
MTTNTSETAGTARIAGGMMIVVGAVGVVLTLLGKAFVVPLIPQVVVYANVTACVLDVALGIGVMQKRRAAWAFAISMFGVFLVVNLLALPGMLRAGFPVGVLSAAIAASRLVWGVMLVVDKPEFEAR